MRQPRLSGAFTGGVYAAGLFAAFTSLTTFAAPRITPSGNDIPENILRIELHLDAPIAAPLDMRHVRLIDDSGAVIEDAFLDMPLPGRDGMSVSILMHPGRIKTGVGPNSNLGMALRQGQKVTLEIDDPQLQGQHPLKKTWTVGAAVRQGIDPQNWLIKPPRPEGREPLRIDFGAALDANAVSLIAVADPTGRRVPGKFVLAKGEAGGIFTPVSPWRSGVYELRIHPDIEDPAGNRLCSAFEAIEQSAAACNKEARLKFSLP